MKEALEMSERIAVYTGSFDPVTLGHLNVIQRAAQIMDRLVIGIGINVEKKSLFSTDERKELLHEVTKDIENIEIRTFSGLAVDFVRECQSRIMIRGVRPLTDIAGEFTMLMANRQLDPEVETIFLMADEEYAHVSSTLIKQITPIADDEKLARFVPKKIIPLLRSKIGKGPSS